MRICIAQTRIKAAAPEDNFAEIEKAIAQAHSEQADVIILPEMALPGYFVGDGWERPAFIQKCEDFNHRIAALSGDAVVIFGSVATDPRARNEDGRLRKFNAALIAQNGKLLNNPCIGMPFWPKTLMPNYREFDDSRHFFDTRKLAAERQQSIQSLLKLFTLTLRNGQTLRLALGICEDAWSDDYPLNPYELMSSHGEKPDLMVNISCSPFTLGKHARRKKLFAGLSNKFSCPVVYVNAVGSQNVGKTIFTFDGDSGVYTPSGFHGIAPAFAAATRTLDLQSVANTTIADERPLSESSARNEELLTALEAGLSFVKDEWKLEKVVIGVSGGIDSALSAVLHARVFGAQNVFCVNMPSRFNSQLTIGAAQKLAKNLGCSFASLSIEESVQLTLNQLDDARQQGLPLPSLLNPLVAENIQARDRGSRILSATASALGAVFPCNANKSETTVGYSTLYGDHAGYLAPIADLWKSDVYGLANFYNQEIFSREVIPAETMQVIPSAELSAEQDVAQGKGDPLCYPYHDALFRLWVEEWNRFDFDSTLAAYDDGTLKNRLSDEAVQHLNRLFPTREEFKSDLKRWWNAYTGMGAFKRVQAPPVLAITRRSFGFDHRECVGFPRQL
ncbi:MAG: hypothetical protein RLZZ488_2188 [Pseudomonadota bacterium]|jgi:NAD+ synthase (glutamine-hydrolysing)